MYLTPPGYAAAFRKVGEMLFTMILENYDPWPGWPESSTRTELRAAVADLRHLEGFLGAVGREHAVSSLAWADERLSRFGAVKRQRSRRSPTESRQSWRRLRPKKGRRSHGGWGTTHSDRESFTVDADRERADLWREAAAERCMSVPSWLADTADVHLRELARSGRATPLPWHRDRFLVRLTDTSRSPSVAADVEVPGLISRPFGIFRGTARGLGAPGSGSHNPRPPPHRPDHRHALPCGRAAALAAELAGLEIDWQETDPERVLVGAPDQEKVQALIRLYEKLTRA